MKAQGGNLAGGCLVLFGLPFAAAGAVVIFVFAVELGSFRRAGDWEKAPATIRTVTLESDSDSDGSTTYSVKCSYVYSWNDREYAGSRVSPELGASSSSRHAERYAILKSHLDRGEPFEAWVNPANPGESMLFREMTSMSWMLLPFGLIFLSVGLAISAFGVISVVHGRARRRALADDPRRPWRAEVRWRRGFVIRSNQGGRVIWAWGLAAFFTLFIGMFVYLVFVEPAPLFARLIVGGFGAIAVGIQIGAVYVTLRFLKYGSPRLELAEMPVVPGRRLVCAVLCRRHVQTDRAFKATLRCQRVVGSGKNSRTETVHESAVEVDSDLGGQYGGTTIPVDMPVPGGLPTGGDNSGDGIQRRVSWALEVSAATPGVDFKVEFDLPVYAVEDEILIEKRPPGGG